MRILITGASRGLGLVLAEDLKDHEITRYKGQYFSPPVYDQGPQDAIVHCAGGGMGHKDSLIRYSQLFELWMLNIGAAAEINRALIPDMITRKSGRVIHVLSIASGEAVGSVGYNTVKTALAGYVRSLGRELAGTGVVVCGVSPGAFSAPNNAMERLEKNHPAAYQEFLEKRLPRGVMGQAQELLPLIRLLLSEGGSMFGGCVLPVDAGEGHYYTP